MNDKFEMRYLDRVILINSSNFHLEEISVGANTFNCGTNSTGKTTFSQICTLFYTGDWSKSSLGLDADKHAFNEFNLAGPRSYIIYEVRRSEEPDDCFLVVLRHTGWPAFLFMDCPYRRGMFVDDAGYAFDSLESIRMAGKAIFGHDVDIRSVKCSKTDKSYIDVLYGWRGNRNYLGGPDASWRKFCLCTCSGVDRPHEKLAEVIGRMFNLGSVKGDIIQGMIIRMLNSPADKISVELERHHASELKARREGIERWLTPASVRMQDDFVSVYDSLLAEKKAYKEYPGRALYAKNLLLEASRGLTEELKQAESERDALRKSVEKRRQEYADYLERLGAARIRLEQNLHEAARRLRGYSSLLEFIPLMEREQEVRSEHQDLLSRIDLITSQREDLSRETDDKKRDVDVALGEAFVTMERNVAALLKEFVEKKQQRSDAADVERQRADRSFEDRRTVLDDELRLLGEERAGLLSAKAAVSFPKEDALKVLSDSISLLSGRKGELEKKLLQLDYDIKSLEEGKELIRSKVFQEYSASLGALDEQLSRLTERRESLQAAVDGFKDSFAGWLGENVQGWEATFGKVVSPAVLGRTDLHPELNGGDPSSLFGVGLDLERLAPGEHDLVSLQESLEACRARLEMLRAEKASVVGKRDSALAVQMEQRDSEIAQKSGVRKETSGKLDELVSDLESKRAELQSLEKEKEEYVRSESARIDASLSGVLESLAAKNLEKRTLQDGYKSELKALKETLRQDLASLDEEHRRQESVLREGYAGEKRKAEEQKRALDELLRRRLEEAGVPVELLESLQKRVEEVGSDVARIDSLKEEYGHYLYDKREYFDRQEEWKSSLESTKKSYLEAEENGKKLTEGEDAALKERDDECRSLEESLKETNDQVGFVDEYFSENRSEEFQSCEPVENDDTPDVIIKKDRASLGRQQELEIRLKSNMLSFRNRLGDACWGRFFPMTAGLEEVESSESAWLEVYDFIRHDVIDSHKQTWNHSAVNFVSDVFYKMNQFSSSLEDIRAMVSRMNRNFKKYNFTKDIRMFEIIVERDDREVMRCLFGSKDIHEDYCLDWDISRRDFLDGSPSNRRFLDYLDKLKENLDKFAYDSIEISDVFSLYFDVREGNNAAGRKSTISRFGSNGISSIFKEIVYLLLMVSLRQRMDDHGNGFMMHCLIDEQATLSSENFNSLCSLANEFGAFVLSNAPSVSPGTEESFQIFNGFYKNSEATAFFIKQNARMTLIGGEV